MKIHLSYSNNVSFVSFKIKLRNEKFWVYFRKLLKLRASQCPAIKKIRKYFHTKQSYSFDKNLR